MPVQPLCMLVWICRYRGTVTYALYQGSYLRFYRAPRWLWWCETQWIGCILIFGICVPSSPGKQTLSATLKTWGFPTTISLMVQRSFIITAWRWLDSSRNACKGSRSLNVQELQVFLTLHLHAHLHSHLHVHTTHTTQTHEGTPIKHTLPACTHIAKHNINMPRSTFT